MQRISTLFAAGGVASLAALSLITLSLGCGKTGSEPAEQAAEPAATTTASGHSHDGWWCDEHGVPEEVCGLCDTKLAADFQKKGDWCADHDRPDSQCFQCHPEFEKQFAAQYEAMYGKQPPKPAS